jgi:hypothetical protein
VLPPQLPIRPRHPRQLTTPLLPRSTRRKTCWSLWHVSHCAWNKLMHALHGNTTPPPSRAPPRRRPQTGKRGAQIQALPQPMCPDGHTKGTGNFGGHGARANRYRCFECDNVFVQIAPRYLLPARLNQPPHRGKHAGLSPTSRVTYNIQQIERDAAASGTSNVRMSTVGAAPFRKSDKRYVSELTI